MLLTLSGVYIIHSFQRTSTVFPSYFHLVSENRDWSREDDAFLDEPFLVGGCDTQPLLHLTMYYSLPILSDWKLSKQSQFHYNISKNISFLRQVRDLNPRFCCFANSSLGPLEQLAIFVGSPGDDPGSREYRSRILTNYTKSPFLCGM